MFPNSSGLYLTSGHLKYLIVVHQSPKSINLINTKIALIFYISLEKILKHSKQKKASLCSTENDRDN